MSRPFTQREHDVIDRLIELAPESQRESLRVGLAESEASDYCSCGCGSFEISYPGKPQKQHCSSQKGS